MKTLAGYIAETLGEPCIIRGDEIELGGAVLSKAEADQMRAAFAQWEPEAPRILVSKLWFVRVLRRVGIWPTLRTWLATLDADTREDWQLAAEIASDDPVIAAARSAAALTAAQTRALFDAAEACARAADVTAADAELAAAGFPIP